jgi:hypothetical protein
MVKRLLGTRSAPPTQADRRGTWNPERVKRPVEGTGLEPTGAVPTHKRGELSEDEQRAADAADAQAVTGKALSVFGKITTIFLRHKPENAKKKLTLAEVIMYSMIVNPKVGQAFMHIQQEVGSGWFVR